MPKKDDLDSIALHIEALIFASDQSLSASDILQVLRAAGEETIQEKEVMDHLDEIRQKYQDGNFAMTLAELNGGYQFLTKKEFHKVIHLLQIQKSKKKLSQAALETLAIIAYRQPITKLEIEQIRGVNCDYSIQKLLEKELITISGKAEAIGKPLLYSTSQFFMDYFGINNTSELPHLKDITSEENTIGENPE